MKVLLSFLVICLVDVEGAPSGHTVYDQKQTGDYNIQVHLKDFQIIALLGDESLGDYDYNYDYADFTIKPSPGANSTQKPSTETSTVSTTILSTSTSMPSSTEKETESTIKKQETEQTTSTTEKISNVPSSTVSTSLPDRIKVQIIEEPSSGISVVPTDDIELSNIPPLGEVLHYRKCANGFTRDKKGRCRRVRRPGHHQFNFGRLASNLASRFQLSEQDSSSNLKLEDS